MSRFLVLLIALFSISCATKDHSNFHLQEDFRDHNFQRRELR